MNPIAALSPAPSPERLRLTRRALAYQFDSAVTMLHSAPFGARLLINLAVQGMLHYRAWELCRCWPAEDDVLPLLAQADSALHALALRYYHEADPTARAQLADTIAARTIRACDDESAGTGAT